MPGILCEHCTGYCCRYIALPIDTPDTREELDFVRWYLMHENISVFIEDGDWYIYVMATCRHLQPDYRCGVYATRPQVCRDYSTENCDYHSGDYGWEHHFNCPEHLDEYVVEHWRPKATRRKRKGARGARKRGAARVRLGGRLTRRPDYVGVTTDLRGVPLPVLAAHS